MFLRSKGFFANRRLDVVSPSSFPLESELMSKASARLFNTPKNAILSWTHIGASHVQVKPPSNWGQTLVMEAQDRMPDKAFG